MRVITKAAALLLGVAACQPAVNGAPAPAAHPPAVSVRQVLTTQALAGATVVVTGRCVSPAAAKLALGSQPRTRNDWQLEDGGVAVWVQGPRPAGCASDTADDAAVTAQVVQDTLPVLSRPRFVRQYLVVR